MKRLIAYFQIIVAFNSFSQIGDGDKLFGIGQTNLSFGVNQGSHPNLVTGKLNLYSSVETSLTIKNIPFQVSGRFSTEEFISGKSSYLRFSYDGFKRKAFNKRNLEGELIQVNQGIGKYQDSIYLLESKIAYWKLKQKQFDKEIVTPEMKTKASDLSLGDQSIQLSNLDSLNKLKDYSNLNQNDFQLPNSTYDSINQLIDSYSNSISSINQKKDSLLSIKEDYVKSINSIAYKIPNTILGGIDKLDLGLTTMGHGNMSNNTIPIQGLRVKGEYKKSFYDIAAGSTVPNRILSNSVFDQVITNSQNIFNLNQFYTVNSNRFVSSIILGLGNIEENSLSVETYYNGREIKNLFNNEPQKTNVTSNISGTWKITKSWSWNASIGKSFAINDTIERKPEEDMALSFGTKYRLSKLNSELFAKVRKIGNGYDGFSQGLYNSGFTKSEIGIHSKISKRFSAQLVGIRQVFNATNEQFGGMLTTSGTLDLQCNVTRRLVVYGGYTLLNAKGRDTLAVGLNHSGKFGFVWMKDFKAFKTELSGLSAVSNVNRIDSNLRLINTNIHGVVDGRILGIGLQVMYQEYEGIAAIYGVNWIVKPELRIHYKGFKAQFSYQFLNSEQFGKQNGLNCRLIASPSELVTWEFNLAKWLPTEAIYIPFHDTEKFVPYYFDIKLRMFLNRNK